MLVQISFTNNQSLPANFDENLNRTTPHIRYANWMEYIVAWRKDKLELYTDHVRTIAYLANSDFIDPFPGVVAVNPMQRMVSRP